MLNTNFNNRKPHKFSEPPFTKIMSDSLGNGTCRMAFWFEMPSNETTNEHALMLNLSFQRVFTHSYYETNRIFKMPFSLYLTTAHAWLGSYKIQ